MAINLSTQNNDETIQIILGSVNSINTVRVYQLALQDF
jgi:hypothetical protein